MMLISIIVFRMELVIMGVVLEVFLVFMVLGFFKFCIGMLFLDIIFFFL